MRGWITDPNGDAGLRLATDLPEPQPADNEAVIDVKAYSINRGELGLIARRPDGFRPGQDVAGVVASQAADGSGPAVGTRVVSAVDWHGWAERVATPVELMAPLPESVSFEQAATLPVAGLTALSALRFGGSILGRRVLITGATGGVGQFAIQLARAAGAHVTAVVSSEARLAEARDLGAHVALAGPIPGGTELFDLVLEGVGGANMVESMGFTVAGGTIALYGTVGGPSEISLADFQRRSSVSIRSHILDAEPGRRSGKELGVLVGLIAEGKLRPLVGLSLDWSRTPDAMRALTERDVRGKAVLTLS
ncbi:MAG TPA: zinc-binding dehydrogenase [Dehalococcoidia bacterium]|nr:zinc-binding dehydrogenase [Dehalococcoidia bacterium]